jgi:hypothetical protein
MRRWAIRNCGIILLKSLIDCLFGSSESKAATEAGWDGKSIKLAYERYSELPDLLLALLKSDETVTTIDKPRIGAIESVFPALDIVRRAGPPDVKKDEIYLHACVHLGSNIWHIREIAARTVSTLLSHENWVREVSTLLEDAPSSTNRYHGGLMAINFFLERQMALDVNILRGALRQCKVSGIAR